MDEDGLTTKLINLDADPGKRFFDIKSRCPFSWGQRDRLGYQ